MAALTTTNTTLLDLAKLTEPNGQIATVAEVLTQTNEMLDDMAWVEGNLPTGNVSTVRTGLPSVTWRKLYGGIQPSKSTTTKVTDTCGMLEALAEVDKALADLNGNTAAYRTTEDYAFLQAMNQQMQTTLIYGNEGTQPEAFTGLAPRFNTISGATNGENIIDGLGSGSTNRSIWLVYWSPMTVHGIVPKGSIAGLQRKDYGEVVIENADGASGRMVAYRTHYRWDAGLTVRDWRAVVRICNIDRTTLTKGAATGADLADLMYQALEVVPRAAALGSPAFYMDRQTMTFLRRQVSNKTSGSTLEIADVGGKKITMFQGIPLRRVDAMATDEARIT